MAEPSTTTHPLVRLRRLVRSHLTAASYYAECLPHTSYRTALLHALTEAEAASLVPSTQPPVRRAAPTAAHMADMAASPEASDPRRQLISSTCALLLLAQRVQHDEDGWLVLTGACASLRPEIRGALIAACDDNDLSVWADTEPVLERLLARVEPAHLYDALVAVQDAAQLHERQHYGEKAA